MATVHVRRLRDDVVIGLKARAAGNNRSLEGEARHILEQAVEEDMSGRLRSFRDLAARLRRQTGSRRQTPSQYLVRGDRDSGHRTE